MNTYTQWEYDKGGWISQPDLSYDIKVCRIDEDGVEVWLKHLRDKRWFDQTSESNFLAAVNEYNKATNNQTKEK